ncbi:hypothetical protein [Burkholderia gladioli]|uniref:hypothetical protein n=1 Tax=Burkholderia gladioli TaxID=28095 RepID=UPI0012FD214A|nr:hypothetical protein [Burkholderia gladioli]
MDKIVIVGGGHVGLTLAVDLHRRRAETQFTPHLVLLRGSNHPFFHRNDAHRIRLENIISGERESSDFPAEQVHAIDDHAAALLDGAALVIVTVPDILPLREQVFEWLGRNAGGLPLNLVFVRGGQGGLISLLSRHRSDRNLRHASMVLVEDSFYGTRYILDKIEFKRKKKPTSPWRATVPRRRWRCSDERSPGRRSERIGTASTWFARSICSSIHWGTSFI